MRLSWALVSVMLVSCGELKNEVDAVRTAEHARFTDVRVTARHGVMPWAHGCPDEMVAFDLIAKDEHGKRRLVTVCCGVVFEGCAVR